MQLNGQTVESNDLSALAANQVFVFSIRISDPDKFCSPDPDTHDIVKCVDDPPYDKERDRFEMDLLEYGSGFGGIMLSYKLLGLSEQLLFICSLWQ